MTLGDSANTAIIKTKSSYKAYEWILKNIDSIEKTDEDYKRHFSEAQQVFSAVDILLRCFVIEKGIEIYDKREKDYITITEEKDNHSFNTNNYCCAILTYNEKNPDNQWLTDVDFSCFVGASKAVRNRDEHLGIIGALQDLYRVFFNLNKIFKALDCTEFSLNLTANRNSFDFSRFDACMDQMCVDDRRYILLADSLHNIEKEYLEVFLQIPWSVIFDFDGASSMGGLQSILEGRNYEGRRYASYKYSEFNVNSNINFTWAHISLSDDDFKKRFIAKDQDDNDTDLIPKIMNKIRDSVHSKATIVVTGLQTERVRDICKLIKSKFLETDIIFLTNQERVQLIEKTDEDDWEETGNIAAVSAFDNSIFDAMKSIFDNQEFFLKKVSGDLSEEREGYAFYALDNTKLYVKDTELLRSKEKYFDFLHLNVGENMTQCNEWEFFHGDTAKWETIKGGYVEPLISSGKVEAFEEEIKGSLSNSCFTIYHLPGFGGTTLGRIIAWDLHKDMPVVCLKGYETKSRLSKDIGDIYTYLFAKHKFLILIDENDFSMKQMQELEKIILDSEYTVKALFVKRISESEARRKQKHHDNKQKHEIIFSVLEKEYKNVLKQKCYHLLEGKGQESRYATRQKHMDDTLEERHKCALIINLYLLEEDFNLENYVAKFLDKIEKDSEGEKYRKMFAFIAMGEYFSNLRIPAAYIARYMDSSGKLAARSIEQKFDIYNGLFLKAKIQEIEGVSYGVKHYLIAQEMLEQLLGADQREQWTGKLPELVKEFIGFIYMVIKGMDKIDEPVKNIISWLFTDKTKSRWHIGSDDVYESSFTSLLMELGEYRRIDVMDYLAEQFGQFINARIPKGMQRMEYELLAHIYAQRARIRSKSQRLDDDENSQDIELQKYMEETMDVIVKENICVYDLEHMLGMCYLEKAKRLKEKEQWEELFEDILENIEKSIERFNYAIWYGSPDYGIPCKIDAITTAISVVIKYYDIASDKRIDKLCEIESAKGFVDDGIKTIQDIDEYVLTTKARTIAERRKDEFEQTCFPDKASEFLQRLGNLESKLSENDYEGHYMVSSMTVYAYEKKHYQEDYRRSSLIHKALRGDANAAKDAERVFRHLDRIVKMSKEHTVSYTTYNLWFEYAKYMQVSLSRAYEQAYNWKQAELLRENTVSQRNNLLRPCYYLFVIQLLRYCDGESITDKDVLDKRQDLTNQISASRANEVVQDWYAKRKGLGHLYSREWIDVKNVDGSDHIAQVQGKVVFVEEEKCNYGYLRIMSPNAMNKWSKAPKGMRYNKDSDVYFSQKQSNFITESDMGKPKKFKFGFAYGKMVASMNSLEKLNVAKTIVASRERPKRENDVIKITELKEHVGVTDKLMLGSQMKCADLRLEKGAVSALAEFAGVTYHVRIPKIYVKPGQSSADLPKTVEGVVISLPTETDPKYSIQPQISEEDVWIWPNTVPFIPAGTEVCFKPLEITGKAIAGKVNGYKASINRNFLNIHQQEMVKYAIQEKKSVLVKMLYTNIQGNGYVLFV